MITRKLGCLPARRIPNQPRLDTLRMMARKAPAKLVRDHIDPQPLMLGNDTLGDCTSAGIGNYIRAVAALGGYQVAVTEADAVQFYAQSTGYVPGDGGTDQGGVEVDVLATAGREGYTLGSGPYFPLWGSIDPQDRNGLALLMAGFGAAYLGVQLSVSDMTQIEATNGECVLTPDNGAYGDTTPGSAGGHCLLGWSYTGLTDADTVDLLTWGTVQKATWGWLKSRIMEAHGLIWPQLTLANGLYPSGSDLADLKEQNAMVVL